MKMNESTEQLKLEAEVIVKLMREHKEERDNISLSIEDVPAEIGNYGLYDGLRVRGAGTSRNMRRSFEELMRSSWPVKRPIYCWKPDTDGSAALWLDHKVRCPRCEGNPIFDFFEIDQHGRDVHGDDEPCECEE